MRSDELGDSSSELENNAWEWESTTVTVVVKCILALMDSTSTRTSILEEKERNSEVKGQPPQSRIAHHNVGRAELGRPSCSYQAMVPLQRSERGSWGGSYALVG